MPVDPELATLHATDRKGRRWTPADDATLARLAGKVDLTQLAQTLHRTEVAVRLRCTKLGLVSRCQCATLIRCPRCGEWRTRLDGGICTVCHKEDTRDALLERERDLLDRVSAGYREWSGARRGGDVRRTARSGLDPVELERRQCERLDRENATLRRRCERMEAWIAARM